MRILFFLVAVLFFLFQAAPGKAEMEAERVDMKKSSFVPTAEGFFVLKFPFPGHSPNFQAIENLSRSLIVIQMVSFLPMMTG